MTASVMADWKERMRVGERDIYINQMQPSLLPFACTLSVASCRKDLVKALRPTITPLQLDQLAKRFEGRTFMSAATRDEYVGLCERKIAQIRDELVKQQRQQQQQGYY